jgi:translation elongation factor EF-Tu-like GTPase
VVDLTIKKMVEGLRFAIGEGGGTVGAGVVAKVVK